MISPHVRVCIGLAIAAIPVAMFDVLMLGRGSGGWISLDFTGILIGAYLLFLPLHFIVSTIGVNLFPKANLWMIHLPSAVIAILLFSGGVYGYTELEDNNNTRRYEEEQASRKLFQNVITLNHWGFSPNADSATNISISVTMSESGRFAVGATGRDAGDYGEWYFKSENEEQRTVAKGEHFDFNIPLKRYRDGVPKNIEITLYLFADSTGSAGTNVIKIFQSTPVARQFDNEYFYGALPKPTTHP
jgi:hypothetical protein